VGTLGPGLARPILGGSNMIRKHFAGPAGSRLCPVVERLAGLPSHQLAPCVGPPRELPFEPLGR
jgi:hypothetical protein